MLEDFEKFKAFINCTQNLDCFKRDKLKSSFEAIINLANDCEELTANGTTTSAYSLRILIAVIRDYENQVAATNSIELKFPLIPAAATPSKE